MRVRASCFCVALIAFAISLSYARFATAGITAIPASNVDAYFGSQSDSFQQSNPAGLNPWTAVGTGSSPYFPLTFLPGVPAFPGSGVTPSNLTPFSSPSSSAFSNAGDSANSTIATSIGSSGTPADAQLKLLMGLTQIPGGTQYAYEQLNYDSDYTITNTTVVNSAGVSSSVGLMAGGVSPAFLISGNIAGSSNFTSFGGEIDYWDVPVSGPATSLGTVTVNYMNSTPGPFSQTVSGTGFIGGINAPDTLRLTGSFFLIADPANVTVQSVPEPSTLALLAGAGIGLCGMTWRRRKSRR